MYDSFSLLNVWHVCVFTNIGLSYLAIKNKIKFLFTLFPMALRPLTFYVVYQFLMTFQYIKIFSYAIFATVLFSMCSILAGDKYDRKCCCYIRISLSTMRKLNKIDNICSNRTTYCLYCVWHMQYSDKTASSGELIKNLGFFVLEFI